MDSLEGNILNLPSGGDCRWVSGKVLDEQWKKTMNWLYLLVGSMLPT